MSNAWLHRVASFPGFTAKCVWKAWVRGYTQGRQHFPDRWRKSQRWNNDINIPISAISVDRNCNGKVQFPMVGKLDSMC